MIEFCFRRLKLQMITSLLKQKIKTSSVIAEELGTSTSIKSTRQGITLTIITKKNIHLDNGKDFLSGDKFPVQTTASEAAFIRASDQRQRNILEIQNALLYKLICQKPVAR